MRQSNRDHIRDSVQEGLVSHDYHHSVPFLVKNDLRGTGLDYCSPVKLFNFNVAYQNITGMLSLLNHAPRTKLNVKQKFMIRVLTGKSLVFLKTVVFTCVIH